MHTQLCSYRQPPMTRLFDWSCAVLILCVSAVAMAGASDATGIGADETGGSYSEFAHSLDLEIVAAIESQRRIDEKLVSELLGQFLERHDADAGFSGLSDADAEVVLRSMLDVSMLVPGFVHSDLVALALRVNGSRSRLTMDSDGESNPPLVASPLGEAYQ